MKYIIQPVELLLSQNVNIMDVIHDRIFKGYDKEILQYIVMKYIRNIEPSFETVIEYSEMRNQFYNMMTSDFLMDLDNDAYVEEADGELLLYYFDFNGDSACIGKAYEYDYPRMEDAEKYLLHFIERNERYIFPKEEIDI